ncbi:MAG TPA: hypothetical protein VGF79_01045 [Bacteroidia bacterium]
MNTELIQIDAKQYGIEENKAIELVGNLPQIISEREALVSQYESIIKMDLEDPQTSKQARELRLKIKDNRTKGIEAWHKVTKDYFLKGGQFVDAIKRKEIEVNQRMEANLEEIEKYQEIKAAKEKAERTTKRMEALKLFPEVNAVDIENMSDDVFSAFVEGLEKKRVEKIEAEKKAEAERGENERRQSILRDRQLEIAKFGKHAQGAPTIDMTDEQWDEILKTSQVVQSKYELEQEKIRQEADRLKKEAQEREATIAKRNNELRPYIVFIRDYNGLISKSEEEYQAEFSEIKKGAELQWEYERKEAARIANENAEAERIAVEKEAERKRLSAELAKKEKEEADRKAEADRLEKERIAAERKAAKAPVKTKIKTSINSMAMPEIEIKDEGAAKVYAEINDKFNAFKVWAIKQAESL